jgi:hypothetical protein
MYNIEYEVKLNDYGRPYVKIPNDYIDQPEDKFFGIEITRYVLNDVFSRRSDQMDEKTIENLKICIGILNQLGDEVALILLDGMKTSGEFDLAMQKNFYIQAQSLKELDETNFTDYMYYNNKLYKRKEGLRALITDENQLYELKKDEENNLNWTEVK